MAILLWTRGAGSITVQEGRAVVVVKFRSGEREKDTNTRAGDLAASATQGSTDGKGNTWQEYMVKYQGSSLDFVNYTTSFVFPFDVVHCMGITRSMAFNAPVSSTTS